MVPLPLFKLAALFVRHVSKYGAVRSPPAAANLCCSMDIPWDRRNFDLADAFPAQNRIKARAHDHPRFRAFAARYGQSIHQLNMRMSVALLRDPEAERRAKERAEAPTVKTEEQHKRDEAAREKAAAKEKAVGAKTEHASSTSTSTSTSASASTSSSTSSSSSSSSSTSSHAHQRRGGFTFQNVWKRKFRPLPETKAVDLFADVIGDAFILAVAGGLIIYETWKASRKPDANKERIDELDRRLEELRLREDELAEAERSRQQRYDALEEALRALQDPKTKQPLLPSLRAA